MKVGFRSKISWVENIKFPYVWSDFTKKFIMFLQLSLNLARELQNYHRRKKWPISLLWETTSCYKIIKETSLN